MNKPPVACGHPMCPQYATYRGYCEAHVPVKKRSTNKAYNDRSKFYNTARWKRVRRTVLMAEPLCRACMQYDILTDATCVDHIVPRVDGGEDYNINNLQPLCTSCHSVKTARDNKGNPHG